jgi:hypothetical protein
VKVTAGELLSPFLNKWGARPHRQFQKSWLVAFAIALSHNRAAIAREVLERDRLSLLASSIALTGSVDRLSNNLHKFADIILKILARK